MTLGKVKYIGPIVPWDITVNLENEQQVILVKKLATVFEVPTPHANYLTSVKPQHWEAA